MESGGIELGPFVMTERMTTGGMGEVWRGRHAAQDVEVAIKVITSSRASSPEAHAPVTSAPALEPATRSGSRPSSSSTVSTPQCAKKPKNPLDMPSAYGASSNHSRSVVTARRVARAQREGSAGRSRGSSAPFSHA